VRARATILLLVLFMLLDIGLVTLAVQHTRPEPTRETPVAASTDAPRPAPSPENSSTPAADATASSPAPGEAPSYVDISAAGVALQGTRGSCSDRKRPVITVSATDSAPQQRRVVGLRELYRTQVDEDGTMRLVGLAGGCTPAVWTSLDDGHSWTRASAVDAWYLTPDRGELVGPAGASDVPCTPRDVSTVGVSGAIRVLCDDGRVLGTSDAGSTWIDLGRLDGAVSIRFTSPSAGFGLAVQDDCPAAVLQTTDGGSSWERTRCSRAGEPVAVGANGDFVAAQIGRTLPVSDDGGVTWSRREG
jgi:photosystem II stability/assembly factor-like uncharacterized protein